MSYDRAMIERRLAGVVVAVVAAGMLAGCTESVGGSPSATTVPTVATTPSSKADSPKPHVVIFTITGDGPVPELTYLDHGKSVTEHDIKLPWTKTVLVPAGQGTQKWDLDIPHSGSSAANVTVDGQPMGGSSGSGSGGGPDLHLSGWIDG
ncbi:MAG: hypothetical protein JWQ81_5279 [Amycolatopsis sp.]|nr:hypothetical protein [Amycolatopsis sp.]